MKSINKPRKLFKRAILLIPCICLVLTGFTTKNRIVTENKLQIQPHLAPVNLDKVSKTSGYGVRLNPNNCKEDFHTGIDFHMAEGETVKSTENGVVIASRYDNSKGNYIVIKHSEIYSTKYYHLKNSIVKKGDKVNKGQVVGYVGHSGIAIGDHLHYEVYKQGRHVNPKDYLPSLNLK